MNQVRKFLECLALRANAEEVGKTTQEEIGGLGYLDGYSDGVFDTERLIGIDARDLLVKLDAAENILEGL